MMTNKELSAQIKKDLKEAGYKAREISVKVRDAGYDTAVHCTVKVPTISRKAVEEIVKRYEEIDRDERTGEILQGCNIYAFVEYDYGVFDDVAQQFQDLAAQALASTQDVSEILPGLFLINAQGWHEIRQSGQYGGYRVSGAGELSKYIYKFHEFQDIAA